MTATLSQGPGATELSSRILEHKAPEYTFAFTPFLFQTYRHGLSPNRPTCKAYLQGHCPLGSACPDKHTSANSNSNFNNLVCKHWLRGLCKKGESCEFLHEYNLRKMPECNFFVRNGYCSNGGKLVRMFQSKSYTNQALQMNVYTSILTLPRNFHPAHTTIRGSAPLDQTVRKNISAKLSASSILRGSALMARIARRRTQDGQPIYLSPQ